MHMNAKMKLQGTSLAAALLLLSACASHQARDDATALRPADRPECQVASSSAASQLARSSASPLRDPCHPEPSIEPGPRASQPIKPDFSGKHD